MSTLDRIRKKKSVSLQDAAFKSEIETIKKIEKQWVPEQNTAKDISKDVLLNEAAGVVADLTAL